MRAKLLGLLVFIGSYSYGQDPHFSTYYGVPISINPAYTGIFNGNIKAAAQFRSQWGSVLSKESIPSYRTIQGSVELRTSKAFKKTDAFAVGLFGMNDMAGEGGYAVNNIGVSMGYRFAFDKWGDHFMSVGFKAALLQNRVDYSKFTWGTNYDVIRNMYVPGPSGETLIENNKFNYDFSAGILWVKKSDRTRIKYHGGVSLLHINRPNISFFDNPDAKLPMRMNAHVGASFPMGDNMDIMPKALFFLQGQSHEEILGVDLKFLLENENTYGNAFIIGALIRTVGGDSSSINPESFAVTARIDVGDFEFGGAYDLNLSKLRAASFYQGAFEFTLAYTGKFSRTRQRRMYCPSF